MKQYKCVNCGQSSAALFKTYGPTVLKLSKCENCNGVVDKYIEYDPVIVIIDLVLVSREAQRHILYNTEFKSFWKLLVILIMLETYGVWRNDSMFNIAINSICDIQNNNTVNSTYLRIPMNISLSELWSNSCVSWAQEGKGDDNDLFIWEKDFYIHFLSTFAGIAMFIATLQSSIMLLKRFSSQQHTVPIVTIMKAFSLANVSILFTLPMLVWGNAETSAETRIIHYTLVFAYSFAVFVNVFTVIYDCPMPLTMLVLTASNIMKYTTSFHTTPYLRSFVT